MSINKLINFIIIFNLLIICNTFILIAKKKYPLEENQLWVSAEIDYELNKRLEFELSEELRYYKNRSVLAQSLTDFGAVYKFNSLLSTGLFYRCRLMPDEDDKRHELFVNFNYKPDIGKFELNNRIRIHVKFREQKETINNLRYLLTLKYNLISYLKPFISTEIFYRFLYDEGDRLSQGRYSAGLEYSYNNNHEFKIYLTREIEYNNDKAVNSSIIGVGYKFSF